MFRFALLKMVKNRWLALSLLAGYLMAAAIVCSMPIYSHAILNRMLIKDLEQIQISRNLYPGRVNVSVDLFEGTNSPSVKRDWYYKYDSQYHDGFLTEMGLEVLSDTVYTAVDNAMIGRVGTNPDDMNKSSGSRASLAACTDFFNHITLIGGEMPSSTVENDIIDAVVTEEAAKTLDVALGTQYDLVLYEYDFGTGENVYTKLCTVEITGICTVTDAADIYWTMPFSTFKTSIMIDPGIFQQYFIESEEPLFDNVQWATAVNYRQMTPENCGQIVAVVDKYSDQSYFTPSLRTSFASILREYDERRTELNATLWIIEVPILLMLFFYIMMVSRLILEHEKNEIAVLQSRGASRGQLLLIYLFQSITLAGISFLAGPLLSLLFCRIIGSSNGFMEFVNRTALDVSITPSTFVYDAITAGVLIITMVFAVLSSGETSIVSFKRKKSGKEPAPLWQKLCLDLVCLAVSGYALYNFQNRLQVLRQTGATASEIPVDFMMYGSSTLFILGGTLLFLRLFPLLIRLICKIGQRFWGPVLYLSLLNTSRGSRKNQMISLFLIFTLSMGVYNSVTVRTLNQNDEDRIRYTIGADINLQEEWPSTGGSVGMSAAAAVEADQPVYYTEPQFSKYENMKTVESAARVYTQDDVYLTSNSIKITNISLYGIVPDEFGRTCWMKNSLLPHHINEYLNLLADEPRALLLSQSAMDENGLAPGDTVLLSIGDNKDLVQFVIYAGIDYFPSFNPVGVGNTQPVLAVANLIYLQQETKLEPYAVWLKKADGVTSAEVYDELEEMGVPITSLTDADVEVTNMKNDPMTQGTNGFFTLSFVVTMFITFVGFFIYWILAIRGRLLQFGLLRSMGLSRLSVVMVLLWEQLLVSVTAILAGLGIGTLTAMLFAPLLECNVDAADQILPFTVTASVGDYWRIVIIVAAMMIIAAAVLGRIVFRLHANEALKLGED